MFLALALTLAACSGPPDIPWPGGAAPATPALLPSARFTPPEGSADPAEALKARAAALRRALGLPGA